MNNLVKGLLAALTIQFLAGCSAKIDATNTETFYASLSEIMREMSEPEKRQMGQDLMLLSLHRDEGMDEVGLDDLYSRYYKVFVPGQRGRDEQIDIYRGLLLSASDLVEGKSHQAIHQDADAIRREWFSVVLTNRKEYKERVREALPAMQKKYAELKGKLGDFEQKSAELQKKKEAMNPVAKINKLVVDKSRFFPVNAIEASVELSNTLDKPISEIRVDLSLRQKGNESNPSVFSVTLKPKIGILTEGNRGETELVSLRLDRSSSSNIESYDGSVEVKWVKFSGERKPFDFTPEHADKAEIWQLQRSVERCGKAIENIAKFNGEIDAVLDEIKKLADEPKEVNRIPSATSVGQLDC